MHSTLCTTMSDISVFKSTYAVGPLSHCIPSSAEKKSCKYVPPLDLLIPGIHIEEGRWKAKRSILVPQVRSIDRVDLRGSIWKEKREEGGDTLLHSATNPPPPRSFLEMKRKNFTYVKEKYFFDRPSLRSTHHR